MDTTHKNRKWWGLLALMPAQAMIFVDQTVLPVALPTIQKQFQASQIQLQWSINAYLLVTAILVLAGGKMGDWIGHRRAFSWGTLIFAIASAICGLAPDATWLIGARALQGIGAALLMPALTALIMSLFPAGERGKAIGINVSVGSIFLILGPLIGGYLTQTFSWRWIFWINLPIAILGLFLVFLFIPRTESQKPKIDMKGFIYFVIGSSSLVIFLMQGEEWGWISLKNTLFFISFLIGTTLLLWREKTALHPFIDLKLFKHPTFRAANISAFAIKFMMMIMVFRAIFFQDILGWSPIQTGFITVLSSCPVLFLSPLGGFLSDKFGPKIPITVGFLLLIFSFIWIPLFVHSSVVNICIGLIAFGCGIPLVLTPSYASAMTAIPPEKAGSAQGTIATIRTLSSTLGVAVIGAFIEAVQLKSLESLAHKNPITEGIATSFFDSIVIGGQKAKEALLQVTSEQSELILRYFKESEVVGFVSAHFALALLLIIAFVVVFTIHHRKSKHQLPDIPTEGWD